MTFPLTFQSVEKTKFRLKTVEKRQRLARSAQTAGRMGSSLASATFFSVREQISLTGSRKTAKNFLSHRRLKHVVFTVPFFFSSSFILLFWNDISPVSLPEFAEHPEPDPHSISYNPSDCVWIGVIPAPGLSANHAPYILH